MLLLRMRLTLQGQPVLHSEIFSKKAKSYAGAVVAHTFSPSTAETGRRVC